ncbi:MAG: glycosyltransferase family 2 protein [Gammaproteobacteria bacterium]|nr:glycosyltransferase family 2 protein [Gammaproteobacteria bacterium]
MNLKEPRVAYPVTVTVITLNASQHIRQCLESVRWADEIVIVDSGSTDDTLTIAREFTDRIVHRDWVGYGPQKQFAVSQAKHDWILSLDADESLSPELVGNIRRVLQERPPFYAYTLRRCNQFMGQWLKHGEGYPDLVLRLFDRRHARWSVDVIHEKVIHDGRAGELAGDLMHKSENGIAAYLEKQNHYTSLQAEKLYEQGVRTGIVQLLFSPMVRFIKFYFIRLGFLDGLPGLVHIMIGCFNSFIKYVKLMELNRRSRK